MSTGDQWIRKIGLIVYSGDKGLDLSEFHIRFNTVNADVESPNNATIRVYNPSPKTVEKIKKEFNRVVLNAGYQTANYGVIFDGTINQFRFGHESNTTTYLDILASDGDIGYTQGLVSKTLGRGTTNADALKESVKAMNGASLDLSGLKTDNQHIPALRGQVLFGMARARVRHLASTLDASWSIQNGNVVITDYKGYHEDQVVELNAGTGLIGFPEQMPDGIRIKCLLNPRLRIGGAVKLDNKAINQMVQADPKSAPIAHNAYAIYNLAPLDNDGIYRNFVVEHEGDTRGQEWYSNIIGLSIDTTKPASQGVLG